MDVGDPSNFARMNSLFDGELSKFRRKITGYSFNDAETRDGIALLKEQYNYIADPHGAIGYLALKEYMASHNVTGVFLETAHPIKFREEVEPVIQEQLRLPDILKPVMDKPVIATTCGTSYEEFAAVLKGML